MRKSFAALLALSLSTLTASAEDPTGEWLVKEKIAAIKIENCSGQMWGVVSWEKKPGGVDVNNPDPGKRRRPTLGMPVLLGMKPTLPNRWEGEIYNAQDGKTYAARISLANPNVLRVEGCLLGFLCGGEEWTRMNPEARPGARRTGQPPSTTPESKPRDVCSRLTELSGSAHQRGLK